MTDLPPLTEADIRALASSQSFDRGAAYYRSDAVLDITRRDNLITGKVEGSSYEPYQVQLTLGSAGVDSTFCSCPYDWGGVCKHIVAVLLTIVNEPETIDDRPALSTLLADLSAQHLRQMLLNLAEEGPEFLEAIEREAAWLQTEPTPRAPTAAPAVDFNAIRREIHKDFRLAGKGDPFEHGYYDEYAALTVYPDEILDPHLDKVAALLDAGDTAAAASLITLIIDAFEEGLTDLDEWVYEYNQDAFSDATFTLGAALAEVILSLDLDEEEQEEWLDQIELWELGLGDLEIARAAATHGWTYPPLVAAMQGNITDRGAWEDEVPIYADELAQVRLRVLARQGRTEAYINLARAEGQSELAFTMLAHSGDPARAAAEARSTLLYPPHILAVARAVAEQGATTAALDLAEYGLGLDLERDYGKVELARWTRDQAAAAGNQDLALKAARLTFEGSPTLADYTQVRQLAGDRWESVKPDLLGSLAQSHATSQKIDIYLHENMLAEAMQVLKEPHFALDHDLHRVINATRDQYPDWGIRQCRKKAEMIMDSGKAKAYATAADWLKIARDIYHQHDRRQEWQRYLDGLLETHHRKYKLVPMLRNIRD